MFAEELNGTAIIGYPLPGERGYQRGDANTCYSYPCLVTIQGPGHARAGRETSGRAQLRGEGQLGKRAARCLGKRGREAGKSQDGSDAALLGKASERGPGQAQQWVGKGDVACLIGLGADKAAHEVF